MTDRMAAASTVAGTAPEHGAWSNGRFRDQSRRNYVARVVGLLLGALALAAALYEQGVPAWVWGLWFLNGFVWGHVARLLARRSDDPARFEVTNLLLDSLFVGIWIVIVQFNLLVAGVLATMVWMNNIAIGAERLFLKGVLASAAGVVLGGIVLGFEWQPLPSQLVVLCSLPMLVLYPQLVGWCTNRILLRLEEKRRILERMSQRDGLSGLNNRQYWEFLARAEFGRAVRHELNCSLILLDIDRFKEFNDTHGHVAGDEVIRLVGRVLRRCMRREDPIGRYGGEEFAVVLTDSSGAEALAKAEAVRQAISQEVGEHGAVTVSAGVAELAHGVDDFTAWVRHADQALYSAKAAGRDCARAYPS